MRFIILVSFLLACVELSHQNEKIARVLQHYYNAHPTTRKKCLAEVPGFEQMEAAYEANGEIIQEEHLGCFIKCVLITENVMSESGEFYTEPLRKVLKGANFSFTEPLFQELVQKCCQMDKNDLCISAIKAQVCFFEFTDKHASVGNP